jgi:hypothetical protein
MRHRYQRVRVRFTPLRNRIRYEVLSPLWCDQMNATVRNRGTYRPADLVWLRVFRTRAAVDRFLREGRVVERTMLLSTLWYDTCDYALDPL